MNDQPELTSEKESHSAERRLPSLDGWRAISIFLVLAHHSTYTFDFPDKARAFFYWAFDGVLGVRCFFVISGFLITYLLLAENGRTGKVSWPKFYARRALRILPAYAAYLILLAFLQPHIPAKQSSMIWWSELTFTLNFSPRPDYAGHLWSISIEEQFYLIWPALLIFLGCNRTTLLLRILLWSIGLSVVSKFIWYSEYRVFLPYDLVYWFQDQGTLANFDILAVGCLTGILYFNYRDKMRLIFFRHRILSIIGAVLLIGIPYAAQRAGGWWTLTRQTFILQGIGLAVLILQSIFHPGWFKPLNWRLVRWIGVLSYSIYMWQGLLGIPPSTYGLVRPWFMSLYTWIPLTMVMAVISFTVLEAPGRRLRFKLRS